MRIIPKRLVLIVGVLILTTAGYAQSSREQFKYMLDQLLKHPSDDVLRENIIKLAQRIKPAPTVPEDAERLMVRGRVAFKGAKSSADYRDAAKEFEQATQAAPWYGDAYFNLGVAQDKAEDFEAAMRSLKLAQVASPEIKEIKVLIYEVEYRHEKAIAAAALARKEQVESASFLGYLNGSRFINYDNSPDFLRHVDVKNGVLVAYLVLKTHGKGMEHSIGMITGYRSVYEKVLTDCSPGKTAQAVYEFSRDGKKLTVDDECGSCGEGGCTRTKREYLRQ